ncbi:hypothetical protein ACFQ2B_38590 [Streptomyces stramineus]
MSTVEPAAVNTAFIDTALRVLASSGRGLPAYRTFRADLDRYYRQVQSRPRRHGLGTPQTVAAAVERALSARTPRPRYVVGAAAHLCLGLHDVLPRAWFETVVRLAFPLPGPGDDRCAKTVCSPPCARPSCCSGLIRPFSTPRCRTCSASCG